MKLWTAMKQVHAYEQNNAPKDIPITKMMEWCVLIHSDNALQDGLRQSYHNTNRYYATAFNELNRAGMPTDTVPGKTI